MYKKLLIVFVFVVGILFAQNVFGAAYVPPAPAPTVSISASPDYLTQYIGGDIPAANSILSWTTTNAVSCSASGGWSGTQPTSSNSYYVSPYSTTTYTLTCVNSSGVKASDSVTVNVLAITVPNNGCSCYWTGAECSVQDNGSGCIVVTDRYTNQGLTACQNLIYSTLQPYCPGSVPAPTVSLSPDSASVTSGGSTTLRWLSSNASSCSASGDWSGAKATSGSQSTGILTTSKNYYIQCIGAPGTTPATAGVAITVIPAPVCASTHNNCTVGTGTANPTTYSGLNTVYNWTCTNGGTSIPCSETKTMSGSLSCTSCTIASGASSCNNTATWSTTNPQGTSAVTSSYPSANTTVATGNSGSVTVSTPYSSRDLYLYNNSNLLSSAPCDASTCATGTVWNGTKCAPVVNCVGSWGTCVNGTQTYTITTPASNGGTACPYTNGATQSCGTTAVCSSTHYSCVSGTSVNNVSGTTTWTWGCNSTDGGTNVSCSEDKIMSGSLTVPSCSIPLGSSSCNVTISWSTTNPVATSAVTSSYPSAGTTVATGNSGSKSVSIPYNSRDFYLYNNGVYLDSGTASATCASGIFSGGVCTPAPVDGTCSSPQTHYLCASGSSVNNVNGVTAWTWDCNGSYGGSNVSCSENKDTSSLMSGSLSSTFGGVSSSSCTIPSGSNSCNVALSWSTVNPVGTSAVTSSYPSANTTVFTGNSGVNQSVLIPYSSRDFYLYNSGVLLGQTTITSSCASGTYWTGSMCLTIPPPSPTTTITATPSTIAKGASSTITWSSANADTCVGTNFNTGGATSGSVSVSPTTTTTYSMVCTGAGGQAPDQATVTVTVTTKKPVIKEN